MEGPHGVGLTTMRLGGVGVREPRDPNQKVHLEAEKAKVDTSGQWWRKDNLQMSYLGAALAEARSPHSVRVSCRGSGLDLPVGKTLW